MNTTWSIRPARVPPRAAFVQLLRTEWLMMLRGRTALFAGLGLPVVLLVIFGSIPAFHVSLKSLGGLTLLDVYLPVLVAMVLMNVGLFSLPPTITGYREVGILRRLSTTPLPPSWVLAVQLILNFCLTVVAIAIVVVLGVAAFGLNAPRDPGGFLIACLLSILALFALGLWIAAVARTSKAAGLIGAAFFYPLLFFAGMWFPQQAMAPPLRDISRFSSLGASVQALTSAVQGSFPPVSSLLVLAAWAIVFGFLAVRNFKWE
jgi:ABC-2 type transport system permease protein